MSVLSDSKSNFVGGGEKDGPQIDFYGHA